MKGLELSYAILRPAVLFGKEDILINNIAWILRRFPVFGVFGTDIFVTQEPKQDNSITVLLDGGGPPITVIGEEQAITIRTKRGGNARATDALAKAKEIHTLLHEFQGNKRTIPIGQITANFMPIPLGLDQDTTKGGRFIVTQTFTVLTRRFSFT